MIDPADSQIRFSFVPYGTVAQPEPHTLVLDVGMKAVPGVIDHHQPDADCECAASLVVRRPELVLDHIPAGSLEGAPGNGRSLTIVTHRMPDFDAAAAAFLALRLIDRGEVDPAMTALADYARLVDSAQLPLDIDLTATPSAILRALFRRIRGDESASNRERMAEGMRFMRFLHARAAEGKDIRENRSLFAGIERFDRAMHACDEDHFAYLSDLDDAEPLRLSLPLDTGEGRKIVDGLVVIRPRSFLLRDWAVRDRDHSPLGRGFSFLMMVLGWNKVVLGVTPEEGVWLKGLGGKLDAMELSRSPEADFPAGAGWYAGGCPFFNHRIIASPREGTQLEPEEIIRAVRAFGRP